MNIKFLLLVLSFNAYAFGASTGFTATTAVGRVIHFNALGEIDVMTMINQFRVYRADALRAGNFEMAAIWTRRIALQNSKLALMREAGRVQRKAFVDLQTASMMPPRRP